MKTHKFILLFLAVLIGFSTCKKDDDDDNNGKTQKPTISVQADTTVGWRGDIVTFTVSVSSTSAIKTLKCTPNPYDASLELDSTFGSGVKNATIIYEYTIPDSAVVGSTHTITFTVTDNAASNSTTKTITIQKLTIGTPPTTFTKKVLIESCTGTW